MVGTNVIYIWFVHAICLSNFSCFKKYALRISYAIEVNIFNNSGVYINQQETGVLCLPEAWRLIQREEYSFGLHKNKIPRKLFVLKRGINREGERCITKNFSICNLQ
jgi:hypothetical protein